MELTGQKLNDLTRPEGSVGAAAGISTSALYMSGEEDPGAIPTNCRILEWNKLDRS